MSFAIQHVHVKTKDPKQTMQFYIDNLGATYMAEIPGRGHALTQQLLDFGRNARNQFRDLDLNAHVLRAETMLGLLLGNHIRIEPRLAPQLGLIAPQVQPMQPLFPCSSASSFSH